jgi:FixJ family two-component response regulator
LAELYQGTGVGLSFGRIVASSTARQHPSVFTSRTAVVAVVDDDEGMRQAMRRVLETEGFVTEMFSTAEDFLATDVVSRARCLVLDIRLPGISGVELHRHLRSAGNAIPTIFVTAHDELCLRGVALRETDRCLVKPFPAEALVQAVNQSISK